MPAGAAVEKLLKKYDAVTLENGGIEFLMEGHSVEFHDRGQHQLTVTFTARMPEKWKKPATARKGWGYDFLKNKGYSALHVKSDRNTWYRLPSILKFFEDARDAQLFSDFDHVMTYGTSMGGFGALAFAGIAQADTVLSYNPQINLGPRVRDWEIRFNSATKYDWDHPMCDLSAQIKDVALPVVIYDPFYKLDRKQVEILSGDHIVRLRVPFVGHHMPDHLLELGVLGWVYSQCRNGNIDEAEFYRRVRDRRKLLRYRNIMLETAKTKPERLTKIDRLLPEAEMIGGA
ncbi:MAG: hypothetical protein ACK4YU_11895 [Paracoccus sp. (in: a-proteobacteria)]